MDVSEALDGSIRLANVLRQAGLVASNKEGVRMIGQGAVRVDGVVVADVDATYAPWRARRGPRAGGEASVGAPHGPGGMTVAERSRAVPGSVA